VDFSSAGPLAGIKPTIGSNVLGSTMPAGAHMKCTYTFENEASPEAFVDPLRVSVRAASALNVVLGGIPGIEWEQRTELLEGEPQFTVTFPLGVDTNALHDRLEAALKANRVVIKSVALS